jgi:hypothetical protein
MDACDAEQAWQLVRALRGQVHEMTSRLDWLERQSLTNFSARRAATLRLEIAALRRDINEAQMFISRLQRRYLADNADGQVSRPEWRQAR